MKKIIVLLLGLFAGNAYGEESVYVKSAGGSIVSIKNNEQKQKKNQPLFQDSLDLPLNNFYFKLGGGTNKVNGSMKVEDNIHSGKIRFKDNFTSMQAGIGFYIADDFRVDATFNYYTPIKGVELSIDKIDPNVSHKITHKIETKNLMLSGYATIPVFSHLNPYFGGGLGFYEMNAKNSGLTTVEETDEMVAGLHTMDRGYSKKSNGIAWKLSAGLNLKLSERIDGELQYDYIYLGKVKPRIINGFPNIDLKDIYAHSITTGIRFNF